MRALNVCTLKELQSILLLFPFKVKTEVDALLLARFLVESNLEEILVLDLEAN